MHRHYIGTWGFVVAFLCPGTFGFLLFTTYANMLNLNGLFLLNVFQALPRSMNKTHRGYGTVQRESDISGLGIISWNSDNQPILLPRRKFTSPRIVKHQLDLTAVPFYRRNTNPFFISFPCISFPLACTSKVTIDNPLTFPKTSLQKQTKLVWVQINDSVVASCEEQSLLECCGPCCCNSPFIICDNDRKDC